MRRLLNAKFFPVVASVIVLGLVAGIFFAVFPGSFSRGQAATSNQVSNLGFNPDIAVVNWDKIEEGQPTITVYGGGYKPGEPVLISIVISTSIFGDEPVTLGAANANKGGAFQINVKPPVKIVKGLYTLVARSTDGVLATSPLQVVIPK